MTIKWIIEALGNQHLVLQTNEVSRVKQKAPSQSLSERDTSQFISIRLLVLPSSNNRIKSNYSLGGFSEITFCDQKMLAS